ncbi:MAG: hypothetical protein HYU87_08590 [Chloroflexi bacterium]|nr:hypothetical protein [Chloroflexota bacterium]
MLRQLARLTHPVDGAHGAVAIAVYADAAGVPIAATDRGHEGVACVDDAARALGLLCDLWKATRLPLLRSWAAALLEFVLYMQDGEGRFVNFVSDWSGRRNMDGPTSFAGGSFWHARGVHGIARASLTFEDPRISAGVMRGVAQVRGAAAPANVRAIHVLTAVELLRAGRMPELIADLEAWCEELAASRHDGVLFDDPDQREPHLWAHLQEGALAEAGAYLGRDDLVEVARESALRYLAPLIDSGFDLPTMQPDGVACALFGVERLAAVTGERRFTQLSERARAWFQGDPAGRPVYDRAAGRVRDGIDAGVLNEHSGAESNIAAAQALFSEIAGGIATHAAAIERDLPDVAIGRALVRTG